MSTQYKPDVLIFASELSGILGTTSFSTPADIMEKMYSRYKHLFIDETYTEPEELEPYVPAEKKKMIEVEKKHPVIMKKIEKITENYVAKENVEDAIEKHTKVVEIKKAEKARSTDEVVKRLIDSNIERIEKQIVAEKTKLPLIEDNIAKMEDRLIEEAKELPVVEKKVIVSKVNCNMGIQQEKIQVKKEKIKLNNAVFMRHVMGKLTRTHNYGVGGRVDGWKNGRLVEIKNRRYKYMFPEYENVQLHAYMKLCNQRSCTLIQYHGSDRLETLIHFDDKYWSDIENSVRNFMMDFYLIMIDKTERSKFLSDPTSYVRPFY